jgi:hypothetical protein
VPRQAKAVALFQRPPALIRERNPKEFYRDTGIPVRQSTLEYSCQEFRHHTTEIFQGFGEDKDEEAAAALENKLRACPTSDEREKALSAINRAQKFAEQFIKDFGQLKGV